MMNWHIPVTLIMTAAAFSMVAYMYWKAWRRSQDPSLEAKKGILEMMWADKKCERSNLAPHQVNPENCEDCPDFDGMAVCNWHTENSSEKTPSGATFNPYTPLRADRQ